MHTEGIESSEEVRQPNNRDLVVAIKNLQRSQATMWAQFQSLRQRIATPQTPQGGKDLKERLKGQILSHPRTKIHLSTKGHLHSPRDLKHLPT
nr:hypothetical protein CFP56_66752 [Quercus suber]